MACATIYKNQSYRDICRPRPLSSFQKNNFNKMKIYAAKRNKRGLFGEISFGMGRRTMGRPHRQGGVAWRSGTVADGCGSCWLCALRATPDPRASIRYISPTSLNSPALILVTLFYVIFRSIIFKHVKAQAVVKARF